MRRTFLIGLDGATFSVLDVLMAEGHMPCLQRFVDEGVRAELLSTPHPLTPPAWTTLLTGRNPGNHGIFDFLRTEIRHNRAFFTLNNFRDIRCETIWTLVSRLGGRILSLNFPLMAPPPAVDGTLIPGMLSWKHLRRNIYPREIYDELMAIPGFDPRELSCDIEGVTSGPALKDEELVSWVRSHVFAPDGQWFNILQHLLKTDRYDLTAVMFDGVDKLQHVCWRFLDPEYLPGQPRGVEHTLRALCLGYFRQIDTFLGELVRGAGPDANVFIASDHGFGPATRSFRINKWLEQRGYLRFPAASDRPGRPSKNSHFVHLDWENTIVYSQSASTNGIFIRVRRAPGEPGVPEDQYHSFRAGLIAELRAIRDPVTGSPFLEDVLTKERAFPGAHQDTAPDLTLVPFDHSFVSVLDLEPVIAVRPVLGTHYPAGIFLGRGPDLARGRRLARQSIVDVAPTLLHSLGLPIPADYEGKVMEGVFDAASRERHPVEVGPATEPPAVFGAPPGEVHVGAAEGAIINRLRALGYIE